MVYKLSIKIIYKVFKLPNIENITKYKIDIDQLEKRNKGVYLASPLFINRKIYRNSIRDKQN